MKKVRDWAGKFKKPHPCTNRKDGAPGGIGAGLKSYSIRGRLDTFVAEVDFGLAAMMGHVDVHGKQDFAARQVSVGRVVGGRELLLR